MKRVPSSLSNPKTNDPPSKWVVGTSEVPGCEFQRNLFLHFLCLFEDQFVDGLTICGVKQNQSMNLCEVRNGKTALPSYEISQNRHLISR